MRDAGRLAAAIEVLTQIDERHRPVRMALKNWGESARYAGSKDRAFVSGLVLDVLRRRRSLGWRMGDESLRAAALGALTFVWGWPLERVAEAAGEEPHGPGPLTDAERAGLAAPRDL
ncbi:MAG: MFS transporter, partial [Phenylobacterium sp.]